MLTAKKWPADAVLFLLLAQFTCLMAGGLAVEALAPSTKISTAERQRLSMIVGTVSFQGAGLVCIWLFLRRLGCNCSEAFGIRTVTAGRALAVGALVAIPVIPLASLLGNFSSWAITQLQSVPEPQVSVRILAAEESLALKIYLSVFTVTLAPLAEELLFRGVLYPAMRSIAAPPVALWGTALFFAAAHYNAVTFLPLTILAVVLAKLYDHTGNLLAPIITHALFNLVNLIWLLTRSQPGF